MSNIREFPIDLDTSLSREEKSDICRDFNTVRPNNYKYDVRSKMKKSDFAILTTLMVVSGSIILAGIYQIGTWLYEFLRTFQG